jgi:hypothetical protein
MSLLYLFQLVLVSHICENALVEMALFGNELLVIGGTKNLARGIDLSIHANDGGKTP